MISSVVMICRFNGMPYFKASVCEYPFSIGKGNYLFMWILILACNSVIVLLLWLLSEIAVTPAYNLMVQYADSHMALPILTDWAFQLRPYGRIFPLIWAAMTVLWGRSVYKMPKQERGEWLVAHTSITLGVGLLQFVLYAIAGILPFLKIGRVITG